MDSSLEPKFCSVAAVFRGSAEPRRQGARPEVLHPAATPVNVPHAELVDAHNFLSSLVWRQVRPRQHTPREAQPRIKASYPSKAGTGLIGAPDVDPPPSQKSAPPVTTARAAPLVSFSQSIETLLSQLARRRLPGFAPRKGF
jgi:hypothetical protein